MNLEQLVYISYAVRPMSPAALQQLVTRCAKRNAPAQVTGLLLYGGGHFMQLLEGPTGVVGRFFEMIRDDPRHAAVRRLLCRPVRGRVFSDWNMGLLNLEKTVCPNYQRLAKVLDRAVPNAKLPPGTEGGLALLREFRQQMPSLKSA